MKNLTVELNPRYTDKQEVLVSGKKVIGMITPNINKEYWALRVKVSKTQAIVGFSKFGCIGIGFQIEKGSWNTNLPSNYSATHIYNHIEENKGSKSIKKEDCIAAIKLIQKYLKKHGESQFIG